LDSNQLAETVYDVVRKARVTDMHTHLFPASFDECCLYGAEEALTYHYLICEANLAGSVPLEQFWTLPKRAQAEYIWHELFVKRTPVSEACRGVLTAMQGLGLKLSNKGLETYLEYSAGLSRHGYMDRVLQLSQVDHVLMTNDPFDEQERDLWLRGAPKDSRFHAALRLDPLLNDYEAACPRLRGWGYLVRETPDAESMEELKRFLKDWIGLMSPVYMAVSLPPSFAFPDGSIRTTMLRECILPIARERNLPIAMMIGVKREVNPALRIAGSSVGLASMKPLEALLLTFPDIRFLVTFLQRENQHECCVLARKFSNLLVFGCWWFMNNPSLIREVTLMRLEMLGTSFVPQHSDARVADQLIYKWKHSKSIIAEALVDKYKGIAETGWQLDRRDIERDVANLFHNNFWRFVKRSDLCVGDG